MGAPPAAERAGLQGLCERRGNPLRTCAHHLQQAGNDEGYISMVLRMRPTAMPSSSKSCPGSTTMVG